MDGYLSCADLRNFLTSLGDKLSPEEIDELIKDGDKHGEGKISCSELAFTLINDFTT